MDAVERSHMQSRNRVVVYVEDDDPTAYLFQKALEEIDGSLRIHRLSDGEQGLAFLLRQDPFRDAPRPDLVVLDINLPKRSGLELLVDLRHIEGMGSVPVVVFSSSTSSADRERAYELGANEFLVKMGDWPTFVKAARSIQGMLPSES